MGANIPSVGANSFTAGPPQGETRPLGGQRPVKRRSVGANIPSVGATFLAIRRARLLEVRQTLHYLLQRIVSQAAHPFAQCGIENV
ncbi:hypothetical protein NBRC116584_33570 [Hydrogenophaga sp. 5NK40-0174]